MSWGLYLLRGPNKLRAILDFVKKQLRENFSLIPTPLSRDHGNFISKIKHLTKP